MHIHIQLYRDINKIVYTYLKNYNHTYIQSNNLLYILTYNHTKYTQTFNWSHHHLLAGWYRVIKLFCIIFIYTSCTLIYTCVYYCMYATIWMCGRQYTLSAASRLAPLSRSIFATSTWPLQADQMRAVQSPYQRQTHKVRETPRDGWYHPPLTDTHIEGHGIYGHTDMQQRVILCI